jgi:hypothetical protein
MRSHRPPMFPQLVAVSTALLASLSIAALMARQPAGSPVTVDKDDLGGVVTSGKGPEAGVWVIAETSDLPTKFAKIAVTDDRGRYLIPDMPQVKYSVWVRGYGLVDSPKVQASPGTTLNLNAVLAPDAKSAAQYYPAGYWFSLLRAPAASEFQHPQSGRMAPAREIGHLPGVSPAGQRGDADHSSRIGHVLLDRAGLGTAAAVGAGWPQHDSRSQRARP